ncbi:hypothetical protein [Paenibacillus glycinis]|uniref:Uncharacterized protein n=1 Tax=Paenibacillus glycinis TaxID=2697035 RepID=A0ABW9XQD7_9BACL|nr:hypothetical protein [Paenibacillus glycinis]NBD24626.1 hypothetical protein [Paenibacillus glycinis]
MNNFSIKSSAPYALNYMIYLQNAGIGTRENERKFPSLDSSRWGLIEGQSFRDAYQDVWAETTRRIALHFFTVSNGLLEAEQELMLRLFKADRQGAEGFAESNRSFHAWFTSFAGLITIERAADSILYDEMKIYEKLSARIKLQEKQELLISLIYDECTLGTDDDCSWHSVISLRDIHLHKNELVSKIAEKWNAGGS